MNDGLEQRPRAGGFRESIPCYVAGLALLATTGVLMFAASSYPDVLFPAYREFSRNLLAEAAGVFSFAPFAVWDLLAIPLALALVVTFVLALVRTRSLWKWFGIVFAVVSAMLLYLVLAWGLNHYAPPLADELSLDVKEYSADELSAATGWYLEQAAALATQVPRESDGALAHQDFSELAGICGASYRHLAESNRLFAGSTAPVKSLLLAGEPLLYWGNTGIFWPFTAESGVPENDADADLPFTMCHEAAHRLGLASEQEANFAAFLACADSDDVRLAYSGYYHAFGYCYNALAGNYPEHAQALMNELVGENPDVHDPRILGMALVFADRQATYEHYRVYEGPVEELGTAANDTYLKTFNEESGVKSYGQVVDYLIAWHSSNGHEQ